MAANQRTEYSAIFSIGGKLLGSFRGAMSAAQARLRGLHSTVMRVGGALKTAALGFAALGGVFAGFAATKIFSSMFEGAVEEAREAEQRTRALTAALMQNHAVHKGGIELARAQVALLDQQNAALEHQGVLGEKVLGTLDVSLAKWGVPPKQIHDAVSNLGDMLVAYKGVNASSEDAAALASAFGRAIFTGQVRGIQKYGVLADKNALKERKSFQARYEYLQDLIKGFKGQNAEAAKTPLGKIQRLQNYLETMRKEIGQQILPLQAQMAEAWMGALPEIKPVIISGFKFLLSVLLRLAKFTRDTLVPAWKDFQEHLQGPLMEALKKIGKAFLDTAKNVGSMLVKVLGLNDAQGKATTGMEKMATLVTVLGNNAKWGVPAVLGLAGGIEGLNLAIAALALVTGATPVMLTLTLAAAVLVLALNWGKVKQAYSEAVTEMMKAGTLPKWLETFNAYVNTISLNWNRFIIGYNAGIAAMDVDKLVDNMAKIDAAFQPIVETIKTNFMKAWRDLAGNLKTFDKWFTPILQSVGKALVDFLWTPITDIQKAWTSVMDAFRNRPGWLGGGAGPAAAATGGGGAAVAPAARAAAGLPGPAPAAKAAAGLPGPAPAPPPAVPTYQGGGRGSSGLRQSDVDAAAAAMNSAPGFQLGGIAKHSMFAHVGEGGPEAVIPLSGGRRALALLDYAARSIIGGGVGDGGGTHVSFAPNITIHGNATETEQRAMDSRLRDLSRDFLKQFAAAQAQERRLSYQGGYG